MTVKRKQIAISTIPIDINTHWVTNEYVSRRLIIIMGVPSGGMPSAKTNINKHIHICIGPGHISDMLYSNLRIFSDMLTEPIISAIKSCPTYNNNT